MKHLTQFFLWVTLCSCLSHQSGASGTNGAADGVAYLAGGCFWGVEHYMQELDGVETVDSGYMGGYTVEPTYQQVIMKDTGHLEVVRVRFDSSKTSFRDVAKRFFEIHDPTQANGQGPDIGKQYLSVVFYTSSSQKKTTKKLIAQLVARDYKVVTKLRKAMRFWPAEEYHQDYYLKSGEKPYCHRLVRRFGDAE